MYDARKLRRVREGPTSSPFLVEQISSEHAAYGIDKPRKDVDLSRK